MRTIRQALDRFLSAERLRAPETTPAAKATVEDLIAFLESYGYQYVEEDEEEYVDDEEEGIDEGEESFVDAHPADILPEILTEFLFEWHIRERPADIAEARVAGEVTEWLMRWLADERLARPADAEDAATLARRAAEEVPGAKRLAELLQPLTQAVPSTRPTSEDEVVEDFFRIVRVEPGQLWLEQDVGPIAVPGEASDIARTGWWVNVVASRLGGTWYLSEVGHVYPLLAEGGFEVAEEA